MSISVPTTSRSVLLAAFWMATACVAVQAATEEPDRIVDRLRIGPFYEQIKTERGGRFWAFRPFYSRLIDPVSDAKVTDVLWPIGTGHLHNNQLWWRGGIAYGSNDNVEEDSSAYTWNLFPIWFSGRTRQAEDYWALFPIYGYLPHTLFVLDDVHFTLFPLYLDYEVNHVERRYWLWPIFSQIDEQPGVTRTGVFPFYGSAKHAGRNPGTTEYQKYALWPFWTSGSYDDPKNPGDAWMCWPLYGQVRRANERQDMVIPPFFSYTRTDNATRWRLPWPICEITHSPKETRHSFFPVYGSIQRKDEDAHYVLWPFFDWFTLRAGKQTTKRFYFFPFYLNQERTVEQRDGTTQLRDRYTRVWPFYSSETLPDGTTKTRVLELIPIRSAGGFERNWTPFWTFYNRTEQNGVAKHELFWGIISWQTGKPRMELPPVRPILRDE